jgi:hypothetical protein
MLWVADIPVVVLTLAALFCVVWGWIASLGHGRTIRQMVAWLERQQAGAWNALPWTAHRLMPQSGIAAMKRRGLTDDPDFRALDARTKRLQRRVGILILAGLICLALVIAGMAFLGWDA